MEKQLPKNWVETDLEHLFNLVYGKGLSVSELLDEGFDVYGANGIIGKYDKFTYEKSKVIISCRGAASGAIHKTKPKSFITSNSIVLDEVSDKLLNLDFVKYAMTIVDKSDVITGTAQPQITIQLLKYLQFPLPPLAEQNRIVEKLDTLFSQLETIKTSMAKVPLLLKDFRQQVLTQAVTGKLTNCKVEEKRLGDLLTDVKYGTSMKSEYEIEGIPIFRIPNISDGEINDLDLKYSKLDEKEYNQLKLIEGDVLIIRSNGSVNLVGRSAIIRKKHDGYSYAGYLIRLRCGQDLNSEFLNYTLKSDFLRTQIVNTSHSSSGVNNINSQEIKDLKIYWTKPKEQQEIVSRVKSLFAKADAIEKQYESLKAKIESLPQAILHKAFKGELTQQLDSDGDARELLREIEGLKAMSGKVSKKQKVKV
jgi:type I restriction enzyme S subunit